MFGSFGWMELLLILIIKGFKKSVHEADAIDVTPAEQSQQGHPQATASNQVGAQSEASPSSAPQSTQPSQVKQG
jgi:sec-independent protein translocase protein TatA